MRSGSNFDREAPGQTAAESLAAQSGGFVPAVTNAMSCFSIVVQDIVNNWPQWKDGNHKITVVETPLSGTLALIWHNFIN
ncbi:hypothetical protein P4S72_25200 [Vibrio sp. PP-XX7]